MIQVRFGFDTLREEVEQIGGIRPRDYQQRAIDEAFKAWHSGTVGVLVRAPTGSGKTVTGTVIGEKWLKQGKDCRVMVIAHERQLVHQFADEIRDITGHSPGIEMANESVRANAIPKWTVSSRQTLIAKTDKEADFLRLHKFDNRRYRWLVITDEVHRWAYKLKSCRPVLEWFDLNPENRRLGLTATPMRGDGTSLAKVCPAVASDYKLWDLDGPSAVADGWAVPYDQRFVVAEGVDFKNLRELKSTGDFDPSELEQVLGEEEMLRKLCQPTLEIVGDRRTLLFSATTDMAQAVARCINGYKPDSAVELDGSHGEWHRRDVYTRHQSGGFQFLSVCGLCVAKGTLILTDCGEVPIEQVTTEMKLWDGIDFVSHDGVISKETQPTIRYAGLTATGDHNVWTDYGWKQLAACKQQGIAIRVSGIGGAAVWESDGHYRDDHSSWQESPGWLGGAVRWMRATLRQGVHRAEDWPVWLQAMCKALWCAELAVDAMPLREEAVQQSARRVLWRLWWARSRVPLCFANSHGTLGYEEPWATQGLDIGPQEQQRPLRARQYSLVQSDGAGEQPAASTAGLSSAEVFDIINAGPRHRFTANGLIVSNCREGYNDPGIGAVAIFRPTKSRTLAEQMKGRGCRPLRGCVDHTMTKEERLEAIAASPKPNCIIVDLVGVSGMADCASTAHILAAGQPDEVIERANRNALKKKGPVDMGEEIRRARREIDDEERERRKREREAREQREREEAARRGRIQTDVRYTATQVAQGHGAKQYHSRAEPRMIFGKHKGKRFSEMPGGYLRSMVDGEWCKTPWLKDVARRELERRKGTPRPVVESPQTLDEINALLQTL